MDCRASVGWKHEHVSLSNGRDRTATNVCGQPYVLQIRSHVSTFGERSPTSSSR